MPEIDNIGNGSNNSGQPIQLEEIGVEAPFGIARNRLQDSGSGNVHRYPIFIAGADPNTGADEDLEIAKECIRFTAVKQGGISLESESIARFQEDIQSSVIRNAQTANAPIRQRLFANRDSSQQVNSAQPSQVIDETIDSLEETLKQNNAIIDRARSGNLDDAGIRNVASAFGDLVERQRNNINSDPKDLEHCFLYMPPSIVYNEGAQWASESIGAAGNFVKGAIKDGSITKLLQEFGAGMVKEVGIAAAIGGTAKIAGILSAAGLGALGQGVPGAIGSAGRIVENPYEEQLFKGIGFRVFNFQFEFNPVSREEYDMVKRIITMFRKHSRPTFTIDNDNQAFFSYPNEFRIEFLHLNSELTSYEINQHLPKIHNCVLTNITTNYTPDQWRAHVDGEPNSILVQLAFNETVKITQQDVEAGY